MARVNAMKFGPPVTNSGSSVCSGMMTELFPPLVTRSRPWSKNWPKKVIHELKPGDRPMSGDWAGIVCSHPLPAAALAGVVNQTAVGANPMLSVNAATDSGLLRNASTAPALLTDMSTMRLEMIRGSESMTAPAAP